MKKSEIRKIAEDKINSGMSHQEVFNELKETIDEPLNKIANILKTIPKPKKIKEYKIAHLVLFGVLIITILSKMLIGVGFVIENGLKTAPLIFILPIINIFLLYGITKYKTQYYQFVGIFSLLSITRIMRTFNLDNLDKLDFYGIIFSFLILVILIGLGFFLYSEMSSKFKIEKETYITKKGIKRKRDKYVFL